MMTMPHIKDIAFARFLREPLDDVRRTMMDSSAKSGLVQRPNVREAPPGKLRLPHRVLTVCRRINDN